MSRYNHENVNGIEYDLIRQQTLDETRREMIGLWTDVKKPSQVNESIVSELSFYCLMEK